MQVSEGFGKVCKMLFSQIELIVFITYNSYAHVYIYIYTRQNYLQNHTIIYLIYKCIYNVYCICILFRTRINLSNLPSTYAMFYEENMLLTADDEVGQPPPFQGLESWVDESCRQPSISRCHVSLVSFREGKNR